MDIEERLTRLDDACATLAEAEIGVVTQQQVMMKQVDDRIVSAIGQCMRKSG